jgi:DNA-binding NarL/FixJ family response regulator
MAHVEPNLTVVLVGDPDLCESLAGPVRQRASLLLTGIFRAEEAAAVVGRAPDIVVLVDAGPVEHEALLALGAALGRALPASRLLLATDHDPADPARLLDAWVGGIVHLDGDLELVEAVEWLAHGEAVLDPALAAAVLARHEGGASPVTLTPTEHEVLRRLAAGDSADTLAAEYAVSPRLVRVHAGGAVARLHPVA